MLTDLLYSVRVLLRTPSFLAITTLTIALGIGVNTAVFSIVNATVLRGLPFPDSERLIHLENNNPSENQPSLSMSQADFMDLRAQQTSLVDLAAYQQRTYNVSGEVGEPERITGTDISASGPAMLGIGTALGRWFLPDEDRPGDAATVVLGHGLWETRFKSDPAIVGKQIRVNAEWATVVGVAPKKFRFPNESDAFMPIRMGRKEEKRDNRYLEVVGRLKPGVSIETARTELDGLNARLQADHPETNKGFGIVVHTLHDEFSGDELKQIMFVMLGAVFLVLLIACANVANMLLSRAAIRSKEIAIRTAIGAPRGRIVRLLLMESTVISVLGGLLGLALAIGLMEIFNAAVAAKQPPYWMVFTIDAKAVAFMALAVVLAAVFAGLYPALRISRPDLSSVLKDGGRGSTNAQLSRFTRLMVVGEVALSCILLALSGLMIRSVIKTQTLPLGFETAGILTNRIGLPETDYKENPKQVEFYRQLLERIGARPEVESVALSNIQPTWNFRMGLVLEGREPAPGERVRTYVSRAAISPGYFDVLGIRLLQGRAFSERDTATAEKTVIVSAAFVQEHFPKEDAIGKRIRYRNGTTDEAEWRTIVGIVGNTLQGEFNSDASQNPQTYVPYTQMEELRFMTVFAKSRNGNPDSLAPVVRQAIRELDNDLPAYWLQSLDAMVADARFFKKLFASLFGVFGGVALVLAGGGLYGVMSYSVSQRTQEIGVRMALGASARDVIRMILLQGGRQLGVGLFIGLAMAAFVGKLITTLLYGVSPFDPVTLAATIGTLAAAGLAATMLPAMRAVRINPVEALRNE